MKKLTFLSIIILNLILSVCLTFNYYDAQADSLALVSEIHNTLDSIASKNQDKRIQEVGINARKALSIIIQSHNKYTYWLLGIVICSSFLIFFFSLTNRKGKEYIRKQSADLEANDQVFHWGNVSYDPYSCLFYINNKKVKIRPLCRELLLYLINASHHYADRKEICFYLWKTDVIDTNDRLRRLICDLRKLLENNKANIVIEAVINGYQLHLKE